MLLTLPADAPPMPAVDVASAAGSGVSPLTRSAETAAPRRSSEAEGTPLLDGTDIIVMDDEPYVRETLARLLAGFGATVHAASRGEEVIELYKRLHANGLHPIALLDLNIEHGLDGIPTLERLLEFDPDARAMACSGYSELDIAHDHEILGFKGYLAKPFKATELIDALLAVRSNDGG